MRSRKRSPGSGRNHQNRFIGGSGGGSVAEVPLELIRGLEAGNGAFGGGNAVALRSAESRFTIFLVAFLKISGTLLLYSLWPLTTAFVEIYPGLIDGLWLSISSDLLQVGFLPARVGVEEMCIFCGGRGVRRTSGLLFHGLVGALWEFLLVLRNGSIFVFTDENGSLCPPRMDKFLTTNFILRESFVVGCPKVLVKRLCTGTAFSTLSSTTAAAWSPTPTS